ncbi:MAG: hypothetical protein WAN16_07550 [Chthoniobacterales bacterium]
MSLDPITKKAIQAQVVSDYLKSQKIDAFLQSEAESFKEGQFRQNQILNRGPRDRSIVDELSQELRPDQWSLAELKKRGVEAFQTCRAIGISGHLYGAGALLLLWPTSPVAGFATREQLQNLQGCELEAQEAGGWIVKEAFFLAGHRYQTGDALELWPDTPTRGFIKPQDALQFLKDSDIEPAELAPVAA